MFGALRVRTGRCKLGKHIHAVPVSKLYYTQRSQGKSQPVQLPLDLLRVTVRITVSVCIRVSGRDLLASACLRGGLLSSLYVQTHDFLCLCTYVWDLLCLNVCECCVEFVNGRRVYKEEEEQGHMTGTM